MNDTARPLQVALIGYGFVGKAFHAPLINAVPGLELSVAASRDAAKVHADLPHAQVIADPLEAIRRPEVDLVVIASPNDTHARWRWPRWRRASTWWWISRLRWIWRRRAR